MLLQDIVRLLDADVLCGQDLLDRKIETCCGSDMMSDVLAFCKCNSLLCTGLTNIQVVRTADMTELSAIVFVRGKIPSDIIVAEATENNLPMLATEHTLFEACGILYQAGLKGCKRGEK
ncbi:MAG: hypothetical protein MJ050_05300 [Phascolarctobacterium sp.]|nr:hypothetical protein [Phascolarctobacterium sp.]